MGELLRPVAAKRGANHHRLTIQRKPLENWRGKRDSYLVSDSLKLKGFLLFLKQERTQFWTCFQGVSKVKKDDSLPC